MHIYDRDFNYIVQTMDEEEIQKYKEGGYIVTEKLYANPVQLEDGNIREATKEELYEKGQYTLIEGEKFEDGQIVTVEKPESEYLSYAWNRENYTWELITTQEELMLKRKDLIMQYKELKTEIETLEEFSEEFESDNTRELLKNKMKKIKGEINELLEIIKKMPK